MSAETQRTGSPGRKRLGLWAAGSGGLPSTIAVPSGLTPGESADGSTIPPATGEPAAVTEGGA